MICTFFGHGDSPDSVKNALKEAIMSLIKTRNVKMFFVGNNGNFDYMAQCVLKEVSESNSNVEYLIVLSNPCENVNSEQKQKTIFPEELDRVPPRFAISKRNEWLINNSDLAIVYERSIVTNTYKWVEKSRKKGLEIINLFRQN